MQYYIYILHFLQNLKFLFEFDKYLTTIIPKHKIFDNYHRFIFAFTDGIYYIEYDKELFNTFKEEEFICHPRYGFKDKKVIHIFIPITLLKKIQKKKISNGQRATQKSPIKMANLVYKNQKCELSIALQTP